MIPTRAAPAGPRRLAFHPDGVRVYVIGELLNSVTGFDDAAGPAPGAPAGRQTTSALPADVPGTGGDVTAAPAGRFPGGTTRGPDRIAADTPASANGGPLPWAGVAGPDRPQPAPSPRRAAGPTRPARPPPPTDSWASTRPPGRRRAGAPAVRRGPGRRPRVKTDPAEVVPRTDGKRVIPRDPPGGYNPGRQTPRCPETPP